MLNKYLLISIVTGIITNQVVASVDGSSLGSGNYKTYWWYIMANATQINSVWGKDWRIIEYVKFMILLLYLKPKLLNVLLVVELMIPVKLFFNLKFLFELIIFGIMFIYSLI